MMFPVKSVCHRVRVWLIAWWCRLRLWVWPVRPTPSLGLLATVAYGVLRESLGIDYNALQEEEQAHIVASMQAVTTDRLSDFCQAALDAAQEIVWRHRVAMTATRN